jgi:hypothetical protein
MYVITLVVNIVLDLIFRVLPYVLGAGLAAIISGTVIFPFLGLVITLVYYRLSGHAAGTAAASGGLRQPRVGGNS